MAKKKLTNRRIQRWAGIRTVCAEPPSTKQNLERIRAKIQARAALTDDELRDLESILFRLLKNEKLLAAIDSQGPGAKAGSSLAPEIALHYLVQKERLGKSAAAWADVAGVWAKKWAT